MQRLEKKLKYHFNKVIFLIFKKYQQKKITSLVHSLCKSHCNKKNRVWAVSLNSQKLLGVSLEKSF